MELIDKIKEQTPYLAAYAWLHSAALREGSDREACRLTMALMRIIRKIESTGAKVQCYGTPEIAYIDIRIDGRTVMRIDTAEQFLNRAFSFARYYNIAPKGEKAEIMRQFQNAQKAYYQYCGEEQYLIPYITMDGTIESLDTENGIWVWNSKAREFEMEV